MATVTKKLNFQLHSISIYLTLKPKLNLVVDEFLSMSGTTWVVQSIFFQL